MTLAKFLKEEFQEFFSDHFAHFLRGSFDKTFRDMTNERGQRHEQPGAIPRRARDSPLRPPRARRCSPRL